MVRRHTADVDLELREAPDDVHDEAWLRVRRQRLGEAIARLPDEQRRALELAFLGGLTHVEVAEREGIPLGTAKTRIRAALLKLRSDLAPTIGPEDLPPPEAPGTGDAARDESPIRRPVRTAEPDPRCARHRTTKQTSARVGAGPEDPRMEKSPMPEPSPRLPGGALPPTPSVDGIATPELIASLLADGDDDLAAWAIGQALEERPRAAVFDDLVRSAMELVGLRWEEGAVDHLPGAPRIGCPDRRPGAASPG